MKKLFVSLFLISAVAGSSVVFAQGETKSCDKQKTECTKSDDKKCCKKEEKKDADVKKCCAEKKSENKSCGKK